MISFESSNISKWLPILVVPLLFVVIVGLSCWYRHRKTTKTIFKTLPRAKPLDQLSSAQEIIPPSQLTKTDKIYLDKLVRTASDRSMWKREMSSKSIDEKKLRKVPSGLIEEKH